MSSRAAIFIEELGLALLPLGAQLPRVRRELADHPVRLVRDHGADLLGQFPALVGALAQATVVSAAGGERLTERMANCVVGSDCVGESVSCVVDGIHLPLCWHHDNQQREGLLPGLLAQSRRQITEAVLARVAEWCAVTVHQLQARDLCWWASVYKVLALLPLEVVRQACRLPPVEPESVLIPGRGYRETAARYQQHEPEVMERDPLAELRGQIKAKPAVKRIEAEPPMLHIPRPKLPRWESANYLAFVRQLPCVVTGQRNGVEAHHLIGHGQGMMGGKTHDLLVFPLVHEEHMRLHRIGWQAWEAEHGSQLEHVVKTQVMACGLGVFHG